MKMTLYIFLLPLAFLSSFICHSQTNSEWLVEMNPDDGTFEAVGPSLNNVDLIYVGIQSKDEINGQYVFLRNNFPTSVISVDINTAEIVHETPYPTDIFVNLWGIHCYAGSDSIIVLGRNDLINANYLAFFDRVNGTELIPIIDSIPDGNPDPWNISYLKDTYDPVNKILYVYSEFDNLLSAIEIPSGIISNTYTISDDPWTIAFDEVNNKLYALDYITGFASRLMVFDTDLGDFITVGETFSFEYLGYHATTIDGNNNIMFVTRNSSTYGSSMMSIDLNTGELLAEAQTMPPPPNGGGLFGGPNTLNGQYFNSTDQLIALHWGEGQTVTSTNFHSMEETNAWVFPNPNQGEFKIQFKEFGGQEFQLKITNVKGQVVLVKDDFRNEELLITNLASGYYIANLVSMDGKIFERIPFIIDAK